jgi:hypothetical protein
MKAPNASELISRCFCQNSITTPLHRNRNRTQHRKPQSDQITSRASKHNDRKSVLFGIQRHFKVFFAPRYVDRCYPVSRGHCCVLRQSFSFIPGHASTQSNPRNDDTGHTGCAPLWKTRQTWMGPRAFFVHGRP